MNAGGGATRAQKGCLPAANSLGGTREPGPGGLVQIPWSISIRFPRPGSGAFARGISRPVFPPGEEESARSRSGVSRSSGFFPSIPGSGRTDSPMPSSAEMR